MQKAISTPIQGPRSKIMSEKNFDQKSRVSVPLRERNKCYCIIIHTAQLKNSFQTPGIYTVQYTGVWPYSTYLL